MTEREKYDIAVNAKLCGAQLGDILFFKDGSRWKLDGLTITPALDADVKRLEHASTPIHPDKTD